MQIPFRLILIIFAVFSLGFFALSGIRFYGLSKPIFSYDAPFFKEQRPLLYVVPILEIGGSSPTTESQFLARLQQLSSTQEARDLLLLAQISGEADFNVLRAALDQSAPFRWVLDIGINAANIDLKISDLISKEQDARIMIQSPFNVVLRSIKTLRPEWVFGSSPADETRLHFYDQLFILPAANFEGDVLWARLAPAKGVTAGLQLVEEIHRRKKKIFMGPVSDAPSLRKAISYSPDAIVFDSFQSASELLKTPSID